MLSFIGGALAKAAMGALSGLLMKLITKELFETQAQTIIVHLLQWESRRTSNKLDDALAAEVIAALQKK